VAVATGVRAAVGFESDLTIFAPYYAASLVAAMAAGWEAGVFATLLGLSVLLLLAWKTVGLPPVSYGGLVDIGVYLAISGVIVAVAERIRRQRLRDREERDRLRLIIEELGHRLTNKLATAEAIFRLNLAEHPEAWATVSARLRALAATDALILSAQGCGADLRDVVRLELEPYSLNRIVMQGEAVQLPPKLALTFALVFHELATNAAKYGALSVAEGRLTVSWQRSNDRLEIRWTEENGPEVNPPTRSGFGSRLLKRAMKPYHGEVRTVYEPVGLRCEISANLKTSELLASGWSRAGPQAEQAQNATRSEAERDRPRSIHLGRGAA
jgi:two-component sensor histidine kinase